MYLPASQKYSADLDVWLSHRPLTCRPFALALPVQVSTFGNYVRQVRHAPRSSGVDLTREERLKKCDELHEYLESTSNLLDGTRRAFKRDSPVHPLLTRVDRQLQEYMQH